MTRRRIASCLVLAAGLAAAAGAARADLMAACAPEIARYCGDVAEGRGRIAACLVGRLDQLGPACKPEAQATTRSRFIPRDMRAVFQPGFSAATPASCAPAAKSYCSGVTTPGRIFACLYAHAAQAGAACAGDARAAATAGK